MNFARMRKLLCLVWLAAVGWLSYPVAAWLHPRLLQVGKLLTAEIGVDVADLALWTSAPPAPGTFGYSLAFFVAFSLACVGLRGRLPDVFFGGRRAWLHGAALIVVGACVVWLGLLFAFSALAALDRVFVGTLFLTAFALLLGLRLFLLSVFWRPGRTIIGGVAAVAVLAIGLSDAPRLERAVLIAALALAMLVSFFAIGGALTRRGLSPLKRLLVCLVAGHALFLIAAFFLGMVDLLPRGLLALSLLVGFVVGASVLVFEGLLGAGGRGAFLYQPDQAARPEAWAMLARPAAVAAPGKVAWIVQRGEAGLERLHFLAGALAEAGRQVVIFVPAALVGQVQPGPWAVVALPKVLPFRGRTTMLLALLRSAAKAASFIAPDRLKRLIYAARPQVLHDRVSLKRFVGEHADLRPGVVIAADWEAAPAAAALARTANAKFVYDMSELETDQYFNEPRWVENEAPFARVVAASSQKEAGAVTVASKALQLAAGDRVSDRQKLVLVRSLPVVANAPAFRPTGSPVQLLYNGDIIEGQGLEALIEAMQGVRERYHLTLRGRADHGFLGDIKRRIAKLGLEQCIEIVLADRAAPKRARPEADVGVVMWFGQSPKIAYSIPTQMVEHVQAGRCVFLVGSGEAADLVRELKVGFVAAGHDAQDIATALTSIRTEDVDACKRAAVAASAGLDGRGEKRKLAGAL